MGYNLGTITNSYSTGSVNGNNSVGGIVGFNMNGIITNSYSTGSVNGNFNVGGLVGNNNGTITNSYSTGSVTGPNYVGGLMGYDNNGTITNSFWNIDIYTTDNGFGTGKTTAEMKQQSTFTDWDFATIWAIDETGTINDGYPYFDIREAPEPPVAEEPSTIEIEEVTYYQIASLGNLIWISEDVNRWNYNYIQTAENIDAETTNLLDGGKGFTPIGEDYNNPFTGTYNGQGNTISNLFINRPDTDYVGLFGYVNDENAKIENLGVTDANITGNNDVGGLVGYNYNGTINNSYLQGSVNGNIKVGGLVGYNRGTISNSYSTGSVNGNDNVGGLVGWNIETITNSYSTGSVIGQFNVGGLVGYNSSSGTITNSFWNTDIYAEDNSLGTGKTTAEMKLQSTFTDWDFATIWAIDETGTINDGYPHLDIREAPEPPVAEEPTQGDGTEANPYEIANLNNLYWLSQNVENPTEETDKWNKHYIQTAEDIDAETTNLLDDGKGFTPIGNQSTKFTGTYDGQGHTISNLFIDRSNTDYVGLFGYVDGENSKIENIGLINVNITGKKNVGGLVGINNETISNSYITGSVNGTFSVGGLVGINGKFIINSYSIGSVSGSFYIGGFVGKNKNNGSIINSYSNVFVVGTIKGGFFGNNIATITNSFWNTTINPSLENNGTGKTTEQMQQQSTFTTDLGDEAWDFDYIWAIDANINDGYPHFDIREAPEPPVAEEPSTTEIDDVTYYQIANLGNLIWLSENSDHWDKHYIQTAENIDASTTNLLDYGAGFTPIGYDFNNAFTGTYNGQEHTISNLFINRPNTNFIGLFGFVNTADAKIENLGVINADITGSYNVGCLVGYIVNGTVSNSYSIGSVTGEGFLGGLVGSNYGDITNSYSRGSVNGTISVGGLVGKNNLTISNSYSLGSVTGQNNVGGLVGENDNGTITSSFWNTDIYSQDNGLGTGKNTAEMKLQSTFTTDLGDEAWDFDYIWAIDANGTTNDGYPYFDFREPPSPEISVSPSSITFDDTNLDEEDTKTFTISNLGNDILEVTNISVESPFSVVNFTSANINAKLEDQEASSIEITVKFSPETKNNFNAFTGNLTITNNDEEKVVSLTGTALAPDISVSESLIFDNTPVEIETNRTLEITNNGNIDLVITNFNFSDEHFSIENLPSESSPLTIAAESSTNVNVKFLSDNYGDFNGNLTITNNDEEKVVSLTGTALAPDISVSENLIFDNTNVEIETNRTLEITNNGNIDLVITNFNFSDEHFSIENLPSESSPLTIAAESSTNVNVKFLSDNYGDFNGNLTITNNDEEKEIALSATALASEISVSETAITFENTNLDEEDTKTFTISNLGNDILEITDISVESPFSVLNFTYENINAKEEGQEASFITITVKFAPTTTNNFEAFSKTLTITNNDEEKVVSLTGTALAPEISVSENLIFNNTPVEIETNRTLAITNNGNIDLVITNFNFSDEHFSIENPPSVNSPLTIDANNSTNITVKFLSDNYGDFNGNLTITNNDEEKVVSLTGTALAPDISVSENLIFDNTNVEIETNRTLEITNNGNIDLVITNFNFSDEHFSIENLPSESSPLIINAESSTNITVKFLSDNYGDFTGNLTITNNDEEKVVSLTGTALAPDISVSKTSIDFGIITIDTEKEETFTISNVGNYVLEVTNISVESPFSIVNFTVVNIEAKAEGEEASFITITVKFAPTEVVDNGFSKVLTITNDDETKTIALSGEAINFVWDGTQWQPEAPETGDDVQINGTFTIGESQPNPFNEESVITIADGGNIIVPNGHNFDVAEIIIESGGNIEIQAGGTSTISEDLTINESGGIYLNSAIRDDNGELSKTSGSLIVNGLIINNGSMKSEVTTQHSTYRKFYISKPISNVFNTSNFQFAADGGKILKLENGRNTEANNENMAIGRGYDIRNVNAQTVIFDGTFNNDETYILSAPLRKRRSALAGNPYPCAIDWDIAEGWERPNLRSSVYIWSEALGRLSSWNPTNQTGTNGRIDGVIPAMCGFIVKASRNNPSLTVKKSARVHQEINQNVDKKINFISNLLRLKVTGKNYSDETVIILNDFISEAENTDKIFEDNEELPHLFTMSEDNFETSINNLFSEDENISIPLHFIAGEHGEFSIEVTENNLNSKNVFIEDKNTGEIKNLENYKFNSKKSDSEDRFVLHFSNENLENIAEKSVKIYSYEKNIYIDNPFEKANVIVYDIAGRKVFEELLNEKSLIKLDIAQKSGTYFVKFYSDNKIVNAKIIL